MRRSRTSLVAVLVGAALYAVPLGCAEKPTKPHVILITVDTLRSDHVAGASYPVATMPFVESLLGDGIWFPNTLAPTPRTTPSLASLLTGAYPHTTGVRRLTDRLRSDVTSLAETLREHGYRTLAVVSNHVLNPTRELDRGFDTYDAKSDWREAARTNRAVFKRLARVPDDERPLFLWVHYIDPHVPYMPPPKLARGFDPGYDGRYAFAFGRTRGGLGDSAYPKDLPKRIAVFQNPLPARVNAHVRALYAADVRDTDNRIAQLVGRVRERLGKNLLIVFTADHGESLGEHDFFYDHGDYVYNASLRVPLGFVPAPGAAHGKPRRIEDWVSLVDVAPTIVDLLGIDISTAQFEGRSLVSYMEGRSPDPMPVFAECGQSFFPDLVRRRVRFDVAGRFRAVVLRGWKLIWTPAQTAERAFELYDLAKDPNETRNLFRPDHPKFEPLSRALETWMARADAAPGVETPEAEELDEEDRRALESLGYLQ